MVLKIDGGSLTIEDVMKVARKNEKIELADESIEKMKKSREVVEKLVARREKLYGISTGIGELSNVFLTPEQVKDFQKYLIYSHAAGWGDPVAIDDARAAWLRQGRNNLQTQHFEGNG